MIANRSPGCPSGLPAPPDVSQLVLVREVVAHFAVEGTLQSLAEPFGKVLCRRFDGHAATSNLVNADNAAERVIFGGTLGLVIEKVANLVEVFGEKVAFEMNITAGDTATLSLTGGADDLMWRSEMGMLCALDGLAGARPAAIGVGITADLADGRLRHGTLTAVASGLVIDALGDCLVAVSLVASHAPLLAESEQAA
jgi:hypothetical protein